MPDPVGYSGKPLIQKLGLKHGQVLRPVDAPEAYADWIAPLPLGAVVDEAAVQALLKGHPHLEIGTIDVHPFLPMPGM